MPAEPAHTTTWTSGWERVVSAFRRSLSLLAAAFVLGAAAMLAYDVAAGALYRAESLVLVPGEPERPTPERQTETQALLATTSEFRGVVASRIPELEQQDVARSLRVTVEVGADILRFTAEASTEEDAVDLANIAAQAYPGFVANLGEYRAQTVSEAREASRIRPAPVRDALIGGALGLMAGLLIMGAREALTTRVRDARDVEDSLGWPVLVELGDPDVDRPVALERLSLIVAVSDGSRRPSSILLTSIDDAAGARKVADALATTLAAKSGATSAVVSFEGSGARLSWFSSSGDVRSETSGADELRPERLASPTAIAEMVDRANGGLIICPPPGDRSTAVDEFATVADWCLLVASTGRTRRAALEEFGRRSADWPSKRGVVVASKL
ncbi:MAG: hypothetical protein M3P95_07400 [Actinomycetota bacterium]|nr:hypothetical protein [Actinomycetota bacterium]